MQENDLRFNQGRWQIFRGGQWQFITDPGIARTLAPFIDWRMGLDGNPQLRRASDGVWVNENQIVEPANVGDVPQTQPTPTPTPPPTPTATQQERQAEQERFLVEGRFEEAEQIQREKPFSELSATELQAELDRANATGDTARAFDIVQFMDTGEEPDFPTFKAGFDKKFKVILRSRLVDSDLDISTVNALLNDSEFIAAMRAQFENENIQRVQGGQAFISIPDFLRRSAQVPGIVGEGITRLDIGGRDEAATAETARQKKVTDQNKAFISAPEEALAGALLNLGRVTDVGGPFGTSPERQAVRMAEILAPELTEFFDRASARAKQTGQGEPEFFDVLQQFVDRLPEDTSLLSLQEREAGAPLETIAEIGNIQRERAAAAERFNQFADIDPFSLVERNLRDVLPDTDADDLSRRSSRLTPVIQREYQRVVNEALAAGNIPEDLNSFIQRRLQERGPVFNVEELFDAGQAGFGGERGFGGRQDSGAAERNVQFGLGRSLTEAIEGRDEADIEFGQAVGSVAGDNPLLDAFIEANRDDLDTRFRAAQRGELDEERRRNLQAILGPAIEQEERQNESLTSSLETLEGARPEAVGAGVLGALKGERAKRQVDFFGQSIEPNLASVQNLNRGERGTLTRETFLKREEPRLRSLLEATPQFREQERLKKQRSLRSRGRTIIHRPI